MFQDVKSFTDTFARYRSGYTPADSYWWTTATYEDEFKNTAVHVHTNIKSRDQHDFLSPIICELTLDVKGSSYYLIRFENDKRSTSRLPWGFSQQIMDSVLAFVIASCIVETTAFAFTFKPEGFHHDIFERVSYSIHDEQHVIGLNATQMTYRVNTDETWITVDRSLAIQRNPNIREIRLCCKSLKTRKTTPRMCKVSSKFFPRAMKCTNVKCNKHFY